MTWRGMQGDKGMKAEGIMRSWGLLDGQGWVPVRPDCMLGFVMQKINIKHELIKLKRCGSRVYAFTSNLLVGWT